MKIGSLFSGYRGLDGAVEQFFAAETVWWSDIDPGAIKINEHHWPDQPNLGDITVIDWSTVDPVDILVGGWPCQPFSLAGKRKGAADERALWPHVARAVRALRPRYVVLENVAAIATAGELARAVADLASLGYVGSWRCLRAADVGAPHGRARVFILATDADCSGRQTQRRERSKPIGLRTADAARAHNGAAADANGYAVREQPVGEFGSSGAAVAGLAGPHTLADPTGNGREQGWPEPAGIVGRPDAAQRGDALADTEGAAWRGAKTEHLGSPIGRTAEPRERPSPIAWGAYEPAIRRWERVLGRPAPAPTETSMRGTQRLSPAFVEHMMGLPAGHVTAVPGLSRNAQLKALGNGVVPQQAYAALALMADQLQVAS